MKKPIPKVESLITFLKFHGWEIESKDEGFYYLKPPKTIKPQDFRVQIPHLEASPAYPLMSTTIAASFADFYDWDVRSLIKFLSQEPDKVEEALQQEPLEMAEAA